ncbi:MAG: acetyltransferase [Sphingobacteriales bacterium]|nr:MAG: acetyltransferase [Sphingobacteriales bacterium]
MIVFGASGHGKVIIEILESNGCTDIEVWDDAAKPDILHHRVQLASVDKLPADAGMVIAVGSNKIRKMIAERYSDKVAYIPAVHARTNLSPRCKVGAGTVVMAGVTINADAVIGAHCIINTNASVDHDCYIGDFVHISPNASLCGTISVGEGTHIGAGATIIPNLKIGKWCTIGAGSVVIKDVPDYCTVVGNPGRIIKQNITVSP